MTKNYTFSIFSENSPGLLHRITVLFTRRKLNIESLTVSETEKRGISRFTIVVQCDHDTGDKVARQIRRIVDVYEVFLCTDEELIIREVALFKVHSNDEANLQLCAATHGMRMLHHHGDSVVLEKSGTEAEVRSALAALGAFGVTEIVRSGRIAMRRDGISLKDVLIEDHPEQPTADSWI